MNIHTYEQKKDWEDTIWYVAAFTTKKENNRRDIMSWCYKTYGQSGYRPLTHEIRWKDGIQYGEVIFSRKEDLEWFILRWS